MKNVNILKNANQASIEALNNLSTILIDVGYNVNKSMVKATLLIVEDKNIYPNGKNNVWEKFSVNIPNTTEVDIEKYTKYLNQKVKANITKSVFWGSGQYQDQLSCEGTIQVISEGK